MQPFILLGGASPRSLKRFINHVRYLAMRVRPSLDAPTARERLQDRVRRFFGRSTWQPSPAVVHLESLSEELLVAFAALQRCGDNWLDALFLGADPKPLPVVVNNALKKRFDLFGDRDALLTRLLEASAEFNARFSASALFLDSSSDVRRARAFAALMSLEARSPRNDKAVQLRAAASPDTLSDQVF